MENEKNLPLAPENLQVALPQQQIIDLFATVSHLVLTPEESKALITAFDDSVIEIRPDGHIYIPQAYYRQRLNDVLGIGQWGLIQKGSYQDVSEKAGGKTKTKFYLPGILVIRKCMVAEAVGEAELHDDNEQQSAASCWEAAKSDCITRCCKDMSIGAQLYQPTYIREWQKKYAIRVWLEGKTKPAWRRADAIPFWNETGVVDEKKPFAGNAHMHHPQQTLPWLNKTTKSGGVTAEWLNITADIGSRSITEIAEIKLKFKLNREIENELMQLLKDAKSKPANTIDAKWFGLLDKCKTKDAVDSLALQHQAELESNADLKLLFGKRKFQLPASQKIA